MQIPKTPPPNWHILFANNLDKAIEFHRQNQTDPHGLGNSAVLILGEVREMFGAAVCGREMPTPVQAPANNKRSGEVRNATG